ncbi:MAG: sugar ABC transporter substrate-binding protein [Chloroflexi bacterium]|nr:sugar ABC transporter substrate-binding protein [Chloroflexota bacterium]
MGNKVEAVSRTETVGDGYVSRRKFLKMMGVGIGGIAAVSLAAGCNTPSVSAPQAPAAAPTVAAKQGATISVLIDAQDEPWFKQRTDPFVQAKNIKVDFVTVSTADYVTKAQTNLAGDTATDLFYGSTATGTYYVFASQGATLDLSPLIKQDNYDLKQFFDGSIKNLSGPFGGKIYGLPYSGHPAGMHWVYNANLVKASGATEPTADFTTDDMLKWAKTMTKGDVKGFYPPIHLWRDLVPMGLTFGASLLSEDNTKAQLNTPEAMKFWEWLYDIFQVSKVSPTPNDMPQGGNMMRDFFIAQKLASMSDSVGFRSIIPKIGDTFKWGVVPFPKGPTGIRAGHIQSNALMIWGKSKQPAAAWEWAKWMVTKESAIALGKISAAPGERPDAWADPAFADDPFHKVTQQLMQVGHSVMNPANFRTSEMQTLLLGNLNKLWNGEAKPEKAFFDDLNTKIQAILDKPKP